MIINLDYFLKFLQKENLIHCNLKKKLFCFKLANALIKNETLDFKDIAALIGAPKSKERLEAEISNKLPYNLNQNQI